MSVEGSCCGNVMLQDTAWLCDNQWRNWDKELSSVWDPAGPSLLRCSFALSVNMLLEPRVFV